MKIYSPEYLHEIGGRSNNEDSIFPHSVSEEDRLFLVCDGVGGQDKGEIASKLVCNYFNEYFLENEVLIYDKEFLESGLQFVEEKLNDYVKLHPGCNRMASTLTLLYLSETMNEALIGWVGDSRIYHIRDGEVIYKTKDHSEVQSLIDMGEISEEEAISHPRKNIITRAVNGTNPTRIDQEFIKDIQVNDFLFLCTDGILENLDELKIKEWFKEKNQPETIKSLILENAHNNTKDNFSMYLVKIKEVNAKETSTAASSNSNNAITSANNHYIIIVLIIATLIALAIIFM